MGVLLGGFGAPCAGVTWLAIGKSCYWFVCVTFAILSCLW